MIHDSSFLTGDTYSDKPIFASHPPITWGINKAIEGKIAEINRGLGGKGYQVLVGSEQEFILSELEGQKLKIDLDQKRRHVLEQHVKWYAGQHPEINPAEVRNDLVFKTQQQEIAHFTAQELLMFELHADEKLSAVLAPKFGTSRTGGGYYDVHSVMEVDVKPATPLEAIRRYRMFIAKLDQKAKEYGLHISFFSRQASISVTHDEKGNPLDANNSLEKDALPVVDSVLKCAFDALPCLVKRYHLEHKLPCTQIDAGPDRINALKVRTDAGPDSLVELRLNDNPLTGGHFAMAVLTLMSGLKLGLLHPELQESLSINPSEIQQRRRFDTPDKEMFFTAEILNTADIRPDGTIAHLNNKQIAQYLHHLAKEIAYPLPNNHALIVETTKISNTLKQLRVEGDRITAKDGSHFSRHPDIMAKLARITRGPVQPVIANEGYAVSSPAAQIECMAQSEPLRKIWGDALLNDVVSAHAKANKLNPSQFIHATHSTPNLH